MKDRNDIKKGSQANTPLSIRVRVSEPYLIQEFVENLSLRCTGSRYPHKKMLPGYRYVDSFTLDAYVSGDLFLSNYGGAVSIPFHTSFLFTCIKGNKHDYKLTWTNSLS
jgi:hypothetical protein